MYWQANIKSVNNRFYKIKHDQFAGFYLYVFEDNRCIHDYLQDTLEMTIECAWEDYGVPKNAWNLIEE